MNSMKSNVSTDRLSIADLNLGDRTELGKYTISTDDIVTFARQWDPQFFHIDEERAVTDGYFGGIIASGIQTLAIFQRLSVKSFIQNLNVIGGAGIDGLQFRRPVRPGDTLTGSIVIKDIQIQSDRGRALVAYTGELINQNAEPVLVLTISAYVQMRTT
ncbi:Acyl dehydratase [Psychrobacter sp. LV10R520-6]|nr:Acyl dehydratase [Psychrobacter sp. LV10R520-6]